MSDHRTRDDGLWGVIRHGDLGVLAMAAVLLLAGWVVRSRNVDATELHRFAGLSLQVPAGWMSMPSPRQGRHVLADLLDTAPVKPHVELLEEALPAGYDPAELGTNLALNLQSSLDLFHLQRSELHRLGSFTATELDYAYAVNPAAREDDPAATDIPVVLRASTLALVRSGKLVRITVVQTEAQHAARPELAAQILRSIQLGGAQ